MAKTRLNQSHRVVLHEFLSKGLRCPAEQKARDRAYQKAARLVSEAVRKKFPPADMEVLTRYKVSYADTCIRGGAPDGRFVGFNFDAEDPLVPVVPSDGCNSRSIAWSPSAVEAMEAYDKAKVVLDNAMSKKAEAYRALIRSAYTFDEVVAVWPAAEQLRDRITAPSTAIVALSEEVAAFIRADNAAPIAEAA